MIDVADVDDEPRFGKGSTRDSTLSFVTPKHQISRFQRDSLLSSSKYTATLSQTKWSSSLSRLRVYTFRPSRGQCRRDLCVLFCAALCFLLLRVLSSLLPFSNPCHLIVTYGSPPFFEPVLLNCGVRFIESLPSGKPHKFRLVVLISDQECQL
jgi:hypothetical protein